MQVEKPARQLRLGFVGTGVITEAVVTGLLATDLEIAEVHVTKRNQEVSARLAASSARVQVHASAQAVVDCSDLVFLAVRPQDHPRRGAHIDLHIRHRSVCPAEISVFGCGVLRRVRRVCGQAGPC